MASPPKVSVVLMTKNRPRLLVEAVDSVAAQSFRDFELIVVDDWSDPPVTTVGLGRAGDPWMRIVRPPGPAGGPGAKSYGLGLAAGEILAFLDDDDLYDPAYLQSAVAALEELPKLDVVFMGVSALSQKVAWQDAVWRRSLEKILGAVEAESRPGGLHVFRGGLLTALLEVGLPMAFQRPVARRRAFEKAGDYSGGDPCYWDNEWALRAIREGCHTALLDLPLYRQRMDHSDRVGVASSHQEAAHVQRAMNVLRKLHAERPAPHPSAVLFERALSRASFDHAYMLRQAGRRREAFRAICDSPLALLEGRRLKFVAGLLLGR